jgi:hypothetical protein
MRFSEASLIVDHFDEPELDFCQRQSKSEPKGSAKCCHFGVSEIAA